MFRIGLTGGIASGKSTVSDILRAKGAWIIDADKLARQVVEPGQPAWKEIAVVFGEGVLLPDGQLNRKLLGQIIFADEVKRRILEDITHPAISRAVDEEINQAVQAGVAVVVLDVPLLIETGWTALVDEVWVVYVSEETQIERLIKRDGLDRKQALDRIASQMRLQDKLQYANVIIDNNQGLDETKAQVTTAWKKHSSACDDASS